MKKTLAFVALVAATIGTAAAQRPSTAGSNSGGNSSSANGNNTVSSGNSSNTSSSATNNNPTTSSPNYKPAAKPRGTGADAKAPKVAGSKNVVVSSGGQGHNTTPEPKGKATVAPSKSATGSKNK